MSVKKKTSKQVTKQSTQKVQKLTFDDLVADELKDFPEGEHLRVDAALGILIRTCKKLGYRYMIDFYKVDLHMSHRTVALEVTILDEKGEVFRKGVGISTRNVYIYKSTIKDAAMEAAQTIALGKALATIGISKGVMASKEEMILFEHAQKINVEEITNKILNMAKNLPAETRRRAKEVGITKEELLDLVDPDTETVDILDRRLLEYIARKEAKASD